MAALRVMVEIDDYQCKLVEADGKVITGQCNQCGWCCHFHPTRPPGVPYPNIRLNKCTYAMELMDGKVSCAVYEQRPMTCVLFPLPGNETGPTCGFKWEDGA